MTTRRSSPLDGWPARVVAACLAVAGLALMGWLGREELGRTPIAAAIGLTSQGGSQNAGPGATSAAKGNPALAACLADRLGTVDKMNDEGILTTAQYELFRTRAIGFCEAEFPQAD